MVTREADANAWLINIWSADGAVALLMTMWNVDGAVAKARRACTKGGRREVLVGEGGHV